MMHRFFVLLYFFALVGLFFGVVWAVAVEEKWELMVISSYQVRCNSNGKYVVLQGAPTDAPEVYQEYVINSESLPVLKQWWRFYCHNYDTAQVHIDAYQNARNREEQVAANIAFQDFQQSVESSTPVIDNFTIEEVSRERDFNRMMFAVVDFLTYLVAWFVVLQIIRMSYVYITRGKIVWHPFKAQ